MRWSLPFARRRARVDAALDALKRAAAAAEAERERLTAAIEVQHRALLLLHDRLRDWTLQPARAAAATDRLEELLAATDTRARALVEQAREQLAGAVAEIGGTIATTVTAQVAFDLAPARAAAEDHAAYLRASLERLRGQADTLAGAQATAAALGELSTLAAAEMATAGAPRKAAPLAPI